ncbi:MAG: ATP-binding protein, partial [Candidatus Neomarinimicrobiota bacterium]
MKKTFFSKIFTGYLIVILSLTGLILFASLRLIRTQTVNTLSIQMVNFNHVLARGFAPLIVNRNYAELDRLTKEYRTETTTRITIIDTTGKVIADSEKDPRQMNNHRFRPEIRTALSGAVGSDIRFSGTVDSEMLYIATPFVQNGQTIAVIRSSIYLSDVRTMIVGFKQRLLRISLACVVLAMAISFLLAKSTIRPIRLLVRASRKITAGDFDQKVHWTKNDEFRELAESFNRMTSEIQRLFDDISLRHNEIKTIISSIQSGLAALDASGKVTFFNDSFSEIVHRQPIDGRFYWEILHEPVFIDFVKKTAESRTGSTVEIPKLRDGRPFLCSSTFIEENREIILLFSDISEMKALQKLKKDFVVNVSHELRTPLTAIKGFIETLQDEPDAEKRRYIDIVARHTDRLIAIVNDLLNLAEIEDRPVLQIEEVDLQALVKDTIHLFEKKIAEKGLNIEVDISEQARTLDADPFRLQQVFINLIDNAVKYTDQGIISISAQKTDREIRIEIRDTGIGIAKEHLPRLFERFYVADKSRSRQLGGTGLGLSIAR